MINMLLKAVFFKYVCTQKQKRIGLIVADESCPPVPDVTLVHLTDILCTNSGSSTH